MRCKPRCEHVILFQDSAQFVWGTQSCPQTAIWNTPQCAHRVTSTTTVPCDAEVLQCRLGRGPVSYTHLRAHETEADL
eukprot:5941805-Amphidinium_carterae.1